MDISLEIIIPIILCVVGVLYFWYSSKNNKQQFDQESDNKNVLIDFAEQLLKNDELESNILQELAHQGCDQQTAEEILNIANSKFEERMRKTRMQYLLFGSIFFLGGIIVTIWSYVSASSHGGTYYITWGAILFGAVFLYKGFDS